MISFLVSLVPTDFWHRHFLAYDPNYHKLGNCDLVRGVWYFTPADSPDSFMGFTRDDAVRSWLTSVKGSGFSAHVLVED